MAIRTRTKEREGRAKAVNRNVTPPPPSRFQSFFQQFQRFQLPTTTLVMRAFWLCILALFYVFFQNRYDKLSYQTAQKKGEMNEKRAIYISKKERYSLQSKQSEISERLSSRGLDKSISPPIKIEVIED